MGTAPHVPTLCLPDVIVCDQISQAFLPPPSYLHTASDPRLDWKEEWPDNEVTMTSDEGKSVDLRNIALANIEIQEK